MANKFAVWLTKGSTQACLFFWKRRWQIGLVVMFIIFVSFVIWPLGQNPVFGAAEISGQWNESIAKLGIDPVFPPEEDVYVGDVYAIVVKVDPSTDQNFLGSSVLLDHVNVRWAFQSKNRDTPIFKATDNPGEKSEPTNSEVSIPDAYKYNSIDLQLVAFPGVTITHNLKVAAKGGIGVFSGNAAREQVQLEQISIPVAETYGIAPPDAVSALDKWCAAKETKIRCTRQFALNMLSYTFGDAVLKRGATGQDPSVALLMISRVFLAREFDVRREDEGKGSVGSQAQTLAASDGSNPSISALMSREYANKEGVRQIFRRPVVFGFRSVKRGL